MTWKSLPDIKPAGVASTLSEVNNSPNASTVIEAAMVIVTANGTSIRFGDSSVAAAQGADLPNNVPVVFPFIPPGMGTYSLHRMWVFGTGNDSVSISYAV